MNAYERRHRRHQREQILKTAAEGLVFTCLMAVMYIILVMFGA